MFGFFHTIGYYIVRIEKNIEFKGMVVSKK